MPERDGLLLGKGVNNLLVEAEDTLEDDLPRIVLPRGNARAQPGLIQVFAEFGLDRVRERVGCVFGCPMALI